jgi:hypothetical protein
VTDQEQKEVRAYCALLLQQHGFHFSPNDPVIPALFVIHKEMQTNKNGNEKLAAMIQEALAKINPQEFHFHHQEAAWKFQMGAAVKWILMGVFVVILFLIGAWYWHMSSDVRRANELLGSSKEIQMLINRVKRDDKGHYFIELSSAEIKRLNPKTVRINLGKEVNQ